MLRNEHYIYFIFFKYITDILVREYTDAEIIDLCSFRLRIRFCRATTLKMAHILKT